LRNYIVLICARGGSKGVPNKNIRPLLGSSLLERSIKIAKELKNVSRIIVSTDSKKIADLSTKAEAEVPFMRPKNLALDDSPEWLVWRHAIEFLNKEKERFDGLIVIPPTAPLRKSSDVERCIQYYEDNKFDIIITVADSYRNPYFNMVKIDNNGFASTVIQNNKKIHRRQDSPKVYDMTTIAYVVNPNYVINNDGIFSGNVGSIKIPVERSLDIDTMYDFHLAKFILSKKK